MKECEIVKDLLPLVAEDIASDASKAFVQTHIETCEDCKKAFDTLKTPVQTDAAAPLKTVSKQVKRRGWLIAGLIACLVAAILIGVIARVTKSIALSDPDEAFASVKVVPRIGIEQVTGGYRFTNVEVDQDTGKLYIVDKNGERTDLDSITPQEMSVLRIEAMPGVYLQTTGVGSEGSIEYSITAYTTLWQLWFNTNEEGVISEIVLTDDVAAVFFEPYNNTDRDALYVREGYTPEPGFALPRLVMNYWFLLALTATILLFVPWLLLLLTKKQKARRVFDILLLIPLCGTLALLAAGFPATTIEPLRDLIFVCIIAVLLFGAGLSARALLKK